MIIKILGTGCPNCQRLESNVREVLAELKIDVEVKKITDIVEIMNYGIMSVPALVIDEEVKIYGRVPEVQEIRDLVEGKNKSKISSEDGCGICSCGCKC
ncbi:MAG: thioredoxin family protein [Candidatus Moraniibacteriota bacterium]